jgi:hypothetical protein
MSPSKPGTPHGMRAVVAYAPEDFRLEEIEVPTPCPGELLVHEALDLVIDGTRSIKVAIQP